MALSFLHSTRTRFSIAVVWVIWMLMHSVILNYLGTDWRIALTDALVSNSVLLLASLIISNTLRYYQPQKHAHVYIGSWCFLLAGLSVFISRWFLVLLESDNRYYLDMLEKSLPLRFCIGFLIISSMGLISLLWYTYQDQKENEKRKADAEKLTREAELYKLRQQLQPHFLFNSLNSISALIGRKPEQAKTMIYQLSDFLRGTLRKEENEFVSLEEELQHLELYLEIEKVRFGHRLATRISQEEGCETLKLPAMLLQPLVENAIKFGLYDTVGEVEIRVEASCKGSDLLISIQNPYDQYTAAPRKGTGFGLSGIKRRLYLLFARNDLVETYGENNIFTTQVTIPQL